MNSCEPVSALDANVRALCNIRGMSGQVVWQMHRRDESRMVVVSDSQHGVLFVEGFHM